MIPKTLNAAINFLLKQPLKRDAKRMTEQDFSSACHFFEGRYLRNQWGLWRHSSLAKWFKARGIHHADDMSSIILHSFWRTVNKKPIELAAQIKYYQDYWGPGGLGGKMKVTTKGNWVGVPAGESSHVFPFAESVAE